MSIRVGMVSLGCPKNLVDAEVMLGLLRDAGYKIVNREESADVLIVNTCGFIGPAKEESIEAILELARFKERGRCKALIVTGCLAQRYPSELEKELPEVDAFVGTGEFCHVVGVVKRALEGQRVTLVGEPGFIYDHKTPRCLATPSYTAYLKIAEGCDNRCSYCVIPSIRGRYRSRPVESLVAEAESLAKSGVRELILVAQDTTRYGEDIYGRPRLQDLLRAVSRVDGIVWLRFLYTYPTRISHGLIEAVAEEPKVCKYIDIPLQHASERILRMMRRRGSIREVRELIGRIRDRIPGVVLRSSFIVGFPGETEADFKELLGFLGEMEFEHAGVFKYSPEEGTEAALLGECVAEEVKERRFHEAMEAQRRISRRKNEERLGRTYKVLIEAPAPEGGLVGRSEAEAPEIDGLIYVTGHENLRAGEFREVRITGAGDYDLVGKLIQPDSI